ncbi:MAG: LamG domain-containing protein [Planctomycetota bacterium]
MREILLGLSVWALAATVWAGEGPIGRWMLRGDSGQEVKEEVSSRKAWLGESPNADDQDPQWSGGFLVFDGKNDCVTVGSGDDFILTTAGTISAWVRPDEKHDKESAILIRPSNWYFVLSKDFRVSFLYYLLEPFSGERITTAVYSERAVRPGAWTHVAVTFSEHWAEFYINGMLDASRMFEEEILVARERPVRIGCEAKDARAFTGTIQGVSIYDRALKAEEIANEMQATAPMQGLGQRGGEERKEGRDQSGIVW